MPTTVPAELTPKAIAVVDPWRFRAFAPLDLNGLVVKLWKFPSLSIVNPTDVPLFEMPFMFVPAPALLPAFGPSKLVNQKPPLPTLLRTVIEGP